MLVDSTSIPLQNLESNPPASSHDLCSDISCSHNIEKREQ